MPATLQDYIHKLQLPCPYKRIGYYIRIILYRILYRIIIFVIIRIRTTATAEHEGPVSISLAGKQERSVMKAIIKNTTNPIKKRIIAPNVIEKYNKKL